MGEKESITISIEELDELKARFSIGSGFRRRRRRRHHSSKAPTSTTQIDITHQISYKGFNLNFFNTLYHL